MLLGLAPRVAVAVLDDISRTRRRLGAVGDQADLEGLATGNALLGLRRATNSGGRTASGLILLCHLGVSISYLLSFVGLQYL